MTIIDSRERFRHSFVIINEGRGGRVELDTASKEHSCDSRQYIHIRVCVFRIACNYSASKVTIAAGAYARRRVRLAARAALSLLSF